LSDFKLEFLAEKIHAHRWPQDSPIWIDSIQKQIDDTINKNPERKQIIINGKTIQIENFKFTNIKKIGISVPFFKDECRMIFEGQFGELFAHIHITVKSGNYLDILNQLISWKNEFFQNNSK
jgi:hypothetical protein